VRGGGRDRGAGRGEEGPLLLPRRGSSTCTQPGDPEGLQNRALEEEGWRPACLAAPQSSSTSVGAHRLCAPPYPPCYGSDLCTSTLSSAAPALGFPPPPSIKMTAAQSRQPSLSSRLLHRRHRRRRAVGSAPPPRPRDRGQSSRPPPSSELEASVSASARAQLERHGCRRRAVELWGAAPHPHASGPPEELCRRAAPRAPPPEHDRDTTSSTTGAGQGRPGTLLRLALTGVAPASPWRRAPVGQRDLRRSTTRRLSGPPRRSTRSRGGRRTRSREGELVVRHGSWGGREWGGREGHMWIMCRRG
jgi:hypothetical protein